MSRLRGGVSRLAARCSVAALALAALVGPVAPAGAQSCPADITGDGVVNAGDLGVVLGAWGQCGAVVSSVSPQHGSSLGGTVITINGFQLQSTTGVQIGGVSCTDLQVLSPTQVRAITPPGAIGDAAITVVSPLGAAYAPTAFSYVLQAITSVTPSTGHFAGGTAITITGSYLAGTTSVRIGGVPATSVVAVNATTVTAVTPAGSVGDATVTVTTPKGTATAIGLFSFVDGPSWATVLEFAPDPAVVIDANLRAGIIATGLAWRVRDNGTQIEMLLVPPGTFNMGCSASAGYGCNPDESPVHQVALTNSVYLGRYEVTQAQWQAKMGSNPSFFQGASYPDAASRPVEQVSWNTIQGFLAATGMRLPTEAEWEYSCRAGTATAFHSGPGFPSGTNTDGLVGNIAWYDSNSGSQTHVVGSKAANALGLHDMSGNVWEWVNDWYGSSYYSFSSTTNPSGPLSGSTRVRRGGEAGNNSGTGLRSSDRYGSDEPSFSHSGIGFRVAKSP